MVVSLVTAELVQDRLPADVGLIDLGEYVLAGLSRPERVFQVVGPGLTLEFPPLRGGAGLVGNLRLAGTTFVGRVV